MQSGLRGKKLWEGWQAATSWDGTLPMMFHKFLKRREKDVANPSGKAVWKAQKNRVNHWFSLEHISIIIACSGQALCYCTLRTVVNSAACKGSRKLHSSGLQLSCCALFCTVPFVCMGVMVYLFFNNLGLNTYPAAHLCASQTGVCALLWLPLPGAFQKPCKQL